MKKRFIFGIGGWNFNFSGPKNTVERFLRVDTLRLDRGWSTLVLESPGEKNGVGYGMIPLESADDDEF